MMMGLRISCAVLLVTPLVAIAGEPQRAVAPFTAPMAKDLQKKWAEYLGTPVVIKNANEMSFVLIPPGTFTMGSPADEEWHRPDEILHQVTLTKPFYLGTTEVSQAQYQRIMGRNPSFEVGDDLPVDTVTWDQAMTFCRKLSQRDHNKYRLATEAEWEYACRAGTTTPFHTGVTIRPDLANYDGSYKYGKGPKGVFREGPTKVGSFAPNAWGLHDMHGNLWEWCGDWYGPYPKTTERDPAGPDKGDRRIFRGGCWINFPAVCRSANRGKLVPRSWNFHTGFRVVRELN